MLKTAVAERQHMRMKGCQVPVSKHAAFLPLSRNSPDADSFVGGHIAQVSLSSRL